MIVDKETLDGFIGAIEVIEEAAKLGVSATAASLSRYQKFGLMLLPNRDAVKGLLGRPANYHPLSVVELAAATWMYRGFLPSINEPARKLAVMARFSTEDIFYARAKFYLSGEVEQLVREYKLPKLSTIGYRTDETSNEIDEVAYKEFLRAKVEAVESNFRQTIIDDNKIFADKHKMKVEFLHKLAGNDGILFPSEAIDLLAKKEYISAIYRTLYYRAFLAISSINNRAL